MEWPSLSELVFVKLGGSIVTDKRRPAVARPQVIERLAQEVAAALQAHPELCLLLGHGSGSFGHAVAAKYGVHQGIADDQSWWGYAETGAAAAQLNRIVTDTFIRVGVPVVSIQPSASARCQDGKLIAMEHHTIREALCHGLVPLIYGDVAFDSEQGCAIVSTESEFAYLAHRLHPARIVLVGEVDGVYDDNPTMDDGARRIPRITVDTFSQIEGQLGGSHGVDVTGGMLSKVRDMVRLVAQGDTQRIHVVSGHTAGTLTRVLLDAATPEGTIIVA
jgi:isopentenyl phosphate kinase